MWRGNQRGTSRHCELSLVLLGDLSSRSSSSSSSSSSRRSGSSQYGSMAAAGMALACPENHWWMRGMRRMRTYCSSWAGGCWCWCQHPATAVRSAKTLGAVIAQHPRADHGGRVCVCVCHLQQMDVALAEQEAAACWCQHPATAATARHPWAAGRVCVFAMCRRMWL